MSLEENKALIKHLFDEVINNYRIELLDEIFISGSMIAASFRNSAELVKMGFPDAHTTIDRMIGEGDEIAVIFTVSGTNTGEFMGQAPTGQAIVFTGMHYYRIKEGRVQTARYEHDLLGLMEQLGMLPSGNRPDI